MTGEILSGELRVYHRLTWQHHAENPSAQNLYQPHLLDQRIQDPSSKLESLKRPQ